MTCFYPMIRIADNYPKTFGEKSKTIKIFGNEQTKDFEEYIKLNDLNKKNEYNKYIEYQKIPCGKCMGCRLEYSKQWATRCVLEANGHEENWFITLTYDEENKPYKNKMPNKETGEIYEDDGTWNGYLEPEHVQKFMKKLRRHWEYKYEHTNIRFFLCGEYGSQTKRPHYHLIAFNLPIKPENMKVANITKDHNTLYDCEEIQNIWGMGIVKIAHVNWSTCAYVARYITKKIGGEMKEEYYASKGQTQEFVRMSRKPGIGREYYEKNKEQIYETDEIIMKTVKGNIGSIKPPKYYDKIYDIDYPEDMEKIKQKRKEEAEKQSKIKTSKTTLTEKEQLKVQERTLAGKVARLKRNLE